MTVGERELSCRGEGFVIWDRKRTATAPQVKQLMEKQEATHIQPYPPSGGDEIPEDDIDLEFRKGRKDVWVVVVGGKVFLDLVLV